MLSSYKIRTIDVKEKPFSVSIERGHLTAQWIQRKRARLGLVITRDPTRAFEAQLLIYNYKKIYTSFI